MTTVHSPTAGRRRLRNALRAARDSAGLTQEQVADEMDWSLSKIIRIETGVVSISTNDLRQLLRLYQIDDSAQVEALVELARIGRRKPWWTRYKETVPGPYLSYVGLEDECSAVRLFFPCGMPGLLQTEEFAHALVDASLPSVIARGTDVSAMRLTPHQATERVGLRLARQAEVLRREPPPQVSAVLDEAVLWRQIGGVDTLRRQLRHLVEVSREPHVTIQVLPFTAHVVTVLSPFTILEFPDPSDADVVYAESAFEHTLLDGDREVGTYREVFEQVRAASLTEEQSLERIAQVADELR